VVRDKGYQLQGLYLENQLFIFLMKPLALWIELMKEIFKKQLIKLAKITVL